MSFSIIEVISSALVTQSRVTLCNPMDCSNKKNSKLECFTGLAKKFVQLFLCDFFP